MACIHFWGSPLQVSTHHFARKFAQAGWQVAYVSAPITPLHLAKGLQDNLPERYAQYRNGGRYDLEDRLWSYVPLALAAPANKALLRSRWLLDQWYRLTLPALRKQIANIGFDQVDVLYLDNFYHGFWLQVLNYDTSIYHMVDDYSAFPGYSAAFAAAEHQLVQSVDVVAYPTYGIGRLVERLPARDSLLLPNGVDSDHFINAETSLPVEFIGINAPIAIYVGALEHWFDSELLLKTAQALPNVTFAIIGAAGKNITAIYAKIE